MVPRPASRARLDVPVGQAPDVGADDERFEGPGPDDGLRVGDDRAHEPLQAAPHLGHRDGDPALGGLDPAGTRPVARAGRLRCPDIPGTAQEDRQLVLDGALDDELGTQATQLAQLLRTADPIEQEGFDLRLDQGAGGYPSFHGVVSFCGLRFRFGAYAVLTFTAISGRHPHDMQSTMFWTGGSGSVISLGLGSPITPPLMTFVPGGCWTPTRITSRM